MLSFHHPSDNFRGRFAQAGAGAERIARSLRVFERLLTPARGLLLRLLLPLAVEPPLLLLRLLEQGLSVLTGLFEQVLYLGADGSLFACELLLCRAQLVDCLHIHCVSPPFVLTMHPSGLAYPGGALCISRYMYHNRRLFVFQA